MNKILVIGVGMVCQNVVLSIEKHKPAVVFFLCSSKSRAIIDGAGKACKESYNEPPTMPNILVQTGLAETDRYTIFEIGNPDDLNDCLSVAQDAFGQIREDFPEYSTIVDVTPGTKSMTIAMFSASHILENVALSSLVGTRDGAYDVTPGTVLEALTPRNTIIAAWHIRMIERYIQHYDYASAIEYIEYLTSSELNIESDLRERLHRYYVWCKAFEAWDRFDHARAWNLMQAMPDFAGKQHYCLFLKASICSLRKIDKKIHSVGTLKQAGGYEAVQDLLHNAERRKTAGRFDDAVGRYYRALEMLAQLRLQMAHGVDTAHVSRETLPEEMQAQFSPGEANVRLSLLQSYRLLLHKEDTLGKVFETEKENIVSALEVRNYSVLAHGAVPIREKEFDKVYDRIGGFIRRQLDALQEETGFALQFPTRFTNS